MFISNNWTLSGGCKLVLLVKMANFLLIFLFLVFVDAPTKQALKIAINLK